MDPLSALAIVAAVVQFVDVGNRLVTSWLKPQKEQQGPSVGELKAELASLTEAIGDVQQSANLQTGGRMEETVQTTLYSCAKLMKRLEELEDAQPPTGLGLRGRFDRTQRMYGKLSDARDVLAGIQNDLTNLRACVIGVLGRCIWYAPANPYCPSLTWVPTDPLANAPTGSIQNTARDGSLTLPTS